MGVLNLRGVDDRVIKKVKSAAAADGKKVWEWVEWVLRAQFPEGVESDGNRDRVQASSGRKLGDAVSGGMWGNAEGEDEGRDLRGMGQTQARKAPAKSKAVDRSAGKDREAEGKREEGGERVGTLGEVQARGKVEHNPKMCKLYRCGMCQAAGWRDERRGLKG